MNNSNVSTIPPLKLIFKGRLEFGTQRAYDLAEKQWLTRAETYFKADLLFKPEDILIKEEWALSLPQPFYVVNATDRAYKTTVELLRELVQFALVGKLQVWCILEGKVEETVIEPKSDKSAIVEYWTGCDCLQNDSMHEASAALSRAIEKYQRHALAYERRGYVNYKLGNFNDALYDFSKSIDINPNNPEPHYGRGKVRMLKNEWAAAIVDFDAAMKRSIAHQPLQWLARLKKGECHLRLKQYDDAAKELKFFLQRPFAESNPNFRRRRRAWHLLGKTLLGLEDINGAIDAFNQSITIRDGIELLPEAEALLYRGIALKQGGLPGFTDDLSLAAELGNQEAAQLLAQWS
jgi:tetratricopeptide (TPR) repeat protein